MKSRQNQVTEWFKSIGIMLSAVIVVGSLLGLVLYSIEDAPIGGIPATPPGNRPAARSVEAGNVKAKTIPRPTLGRNERKDGSATNLTASESVKALAGLGDVAARGNDAARQGGSSTSQRTGSVEATFPASGKGARPDLEKEFEAPAPLQQVPNPASGASGKAADAGSPAGRPASAASNAAAGTGKNAATAEGKRSPSRWRKVLKDLHERGFHARGSSLTRRRARDKADAELNAINDPAAVPAVWDVFAGTTEHHQVVAEILGRIVSPESTKGLVALSVYSEDEKARRQAINALLKRDSKEYAELLIGIFSRPMKYRPETINIPGQGRGQVLLVEGERVDYQFLYLSEQQPRPVNNGGVFSRDHRYMTPSERQRAREFNAAQAEMARAASKAQLQSDIAEVERLNHRVVAMNDRVAGVLTEVSGERIGPDREAWSRWLAARQGKTYSPPRTDQKPTIAQIVPPLFSPQFIPIPAAPT